MDVTLFGFMHVIARRCLAALFRFFNLTTNYLEFQKTIVIYLLQKN